MEHTLLTWHKFLPDTILQPVLRRVQLQLRRQRALSSSGLRDAREQGTLPTLAALAVVLDYTKISVGPLQTPPHTPAPISGDLGEDSPDG